MGNATALHRVGTGDFTRTKKQIITNSLHISARGVDPQITCRWIIRHCLSTFDTARGTMRVSLGTDVIILASQGATVACLAKAALVHPT
jgi:hypothetical protein